MRARTDLPLYGQDRGLGLDLESAALCQGQSHLTPGTGHDALKRGARDAHAEGGLGQALQVGQAQRLQFVGEHEDTVSAENLASHGYVVVGIDPTYSSNLIVLPDGRVALRTENGMMPDNADAAAADQDAGRIGKVWTEDAVFVMNQLQHIDTDAASLFYKKLDLAHFGLFGHSFGGATAASVCKTDARCQAGAGLDGTLFSYQADRALQRPFLFVPEDGCGKDCETMRQAYSASNSAAYYLSIKDTRHFNFSDLPLRLSPPARVLFRGLGVIGSIQPERGLAISDAQRVAFLDRYLTHIAVASSIGSRRTLCRDHTMVGKIRQLSPCGEPLRSNVVDARTKKATAQNS